jgi:hypothetical protein
MDYETAKSGIFKAYPDQPLYIFGEQTITEGRLENGQEVFRTYPHNPGYKDQDVSKQTAQNLSKDKIRAIHQEILGIIDQGATTEEIIDDLWALAPQILEGESFFDYAKRYHAHATYIKPRVTEMLKETKERPALLKDSGIRRATFSGNMSKVWISC